MGLDQWTATAHPKPWVFWLAGWGVFVSLLFLPVCRAQISGGRAYERVLIVANGTLPGTGPIQQLAKRCCVLALDGAYHKCLIAGVTPDMVLGDFDSLNEPQPLPSPGQATPGAHAREALKHFATIPPPQGPLTFETYTQCTHHAGQKPPTVFIRAACQDFTDLEKALHFLRDKTKHVIITAALGGDTDHLLGNLNLLKKYRTYFQSLRILSPVASSKGKKGAWEEIRMSSNETLTLHGTPGDTISIFGFPKAIVTSQGLVWEMSTYPLEQGKQDSLRNQCKTPKVTVSIQGDALIIRKGSPPDHR